MGCKASKPVSGSISEDFAKGNGPRRAPLDELPPYEPAIFPMEEQERLNNLWSLNILDTPADPRLDDITKLLCKIFNMPISIISLVDQYRCWLKSEVGLPIGQADRDISMCTWTVIPAHAEMLVIEDASKDARFKNCPLVTGPPNVRFYAAAPLVTSLGHLLGALCVIDTKPRKFEAESCNILANFGELVVRQIENTTASYVRGMKTAQRATRLLRSFDCFSEAIMLCRFEGDKEKVVYVNQSWSKVTGVAEDDVLGNSFLGFATEKIQEGGSTMLQTADTNPSEFTVAFKMKNSKKMVTVSFRSARLGPLNDNMPLVGIPSSIPWDPSGFSENLYFGTVKQCSTMTDQANEHLQSKISASKSARRVEVPFDGVKMGPIVGKGSFGKVYRGSYYGSPVAIKVIQVDPMQQEGVKQNNMEETLFDLNVSHPNIVRTYKTATKIVTFEIASPVSELSHMTSMSSSGQQCSGGGTPNTSTGTTGSGLLIKAGGGTDSPMDSSRRTSTEDGYFPMGDSSDGMTMESGSRSPRGPLDTQEVSSYEKELCEAWLLLEYCDLGTLTDCIERGLFRTPRCNPAGSPDLSAIINAAREVASAMSYLHSRDILHGDLTGGNVLLCTGRVKDSFTCKVSDFGLSRMATEGVIMTDTTGTPSHMPPEMLAEGLLSKGVDVYAFGMLLWEMYHGKRAWAGMQAIQIIFHVAVKKKVLEIDAGAPPSLKALILSCISSDVNERPSFDQILTILEDIAPTSNQVDLTNFTQKLTV